MKNYSKLQKGFLNVITALIIGALAVIAGAGIDRLTNSNSAPKVGSVNYVTGGGTYRLASSISSTQTSITLSSFKEPVSNTPYTMSYLNSAKEYMTLDPQTTNSEFISFTGITQNSDGTATLTGVTRGLSRSYPYTASSTFQLTHSGQSIAILSNSPQIYNDIYSYINNATYAGTVDATQVIKGVVLVASSTGAAYNYPAYTDGATTTFYALTTSIASSTRTANTAQVVVSSSTDGYIDNSYINLSTGSITLATTTTIGSTYAFDIGKHIKVFTSTGSTTWAIPNGIKTVKVELVGGGGSGGSGGGGGAAGYAMKMLDVSGTSTLIVKVAAASSYSAVGTTSSFYIIANAGSVGSSPLGGSGGTATGGDLNVTGGDGGQYDYDSNSSSYTSNGGTGGASFFGGGGHGAQGGTGTACAAGSAYGSGGGGGGSQTGPSSQGGCSGAQGVVIITY